jgi:hypothetical protein
MPSGGVGVEEFPVQKYPPKQGPEGVDKPSVPQNSPGGHERQDASTVMPSKGL